MKELCSPAIIYLLFSITQILIDTYNKLYNTVFVKIIVTVNAEFIIHANKDPEFNKLIAENFGTFDGQIPYILAKRKFKNVFFEKISGSSFIYDICEFSKKNNKKVFLLGGHLDSNSKSVSILSERYQIEVSGFSPDYMPYPFEAKHDEAIIRLNRLRRIHAIPSRMIAPVTAVEIP